MTEAIAHHGKFLHPRRVFTVFKWSVYFLLAWNAIQFFQEDLAASAVTFNHHITWHNAVEAFSASIDTTAWLVLLLVFEFETAIFSDEQLKGGLKWFLAVLKAACYLLIIWSFYGYLQKYLLITDLAPFGSVDVCSLVGTGWNYVVDLDDYLPIDASACAAMQGQELLQVSGTEMVGTREALDSAWGLAVIDIINSATWLVIVVLLEAEVWMQLRDALTNRLMKAGKYLKGFLYSILFAAAVYWGFEGSFLDFWDAFLWLVAFVLIELNIFQWHQEVEEEQGAGGEQAPA